MTHFIRKITMTKELLLELYIEKEMSITSIAKELNKNSKTISKYLDKFDIPKRTRINPSQIVECKECGKSRTKKYADIKKTKNNFCSKSCSAKYTNRHRDSSTYRQLEGKCRDCDSPIRSQLTYCKKCWNKKSADYLSDNETIKDVVYRDHHKSSAFAKIRGRARLKAKKEGWNSCKVCGYDKHIEIAHIRAIADFSEDALVSEVNDIENLAPLCPTCHWELDNSLIKL